MYVYKNIFIYALVCPVINKIRYVGKSERPDLRLNSHMNDKSKCHRANWLQNLKSKGLKPSLIILEEIRGFYPWQESEIYWIKKGKELGWPLTNNTIGGDGVSGLPKETKDRMKKVWLGRKHKKESLVKIGEASKGRKHTEQHKEKMRSLMKNRDITWGDKISENLRKFSDDDLLTIQERLSNGEMVKDLALEYGVHRTTISKIKKGTYKDKKGKKK